VGGHNLVKMSDLKSGFESLGLARVSAYKASGNVIFESESAPQAEYLDKKLGRALGVKAPILLRSIEEVRSIVDLNPLQRLEGGPTKILRHLHGSGPAEESKDSSTFSEGRCRIDTQKEFGHF